MTTPREIPRKWISMPSAAFPDDTFDQDIGRLAAEPDWLDHGQSIVLFAHAYDECRTFRGLELSGFYAGYRLPFPSRHRSANCLA
jgi:hypothetical protein